MIRKAKLPEIEKLLIITRSCAAKMTSEGIQQWNDFYTNKEVFQKDMQRGELFVLISDAVPIGCITISSEKDIEYNNVDWLTKDDRHYYIHRLAVAPEFQKLGYAKKLMDFAEDLAKNNNINSIRLDTFSKNRRNQKFYEARGYKRLGTIFFPKQSEYPFYCYEKLF